MELFSLCFNRSFLCSSIQTVLFAKRSLLLYFYVCSLSTFCPYSSFLTYIHSPWCYQFSFTLKSFPQLITLTEFLLRYILHKLRVAYLGQNYPHSALKDTHTSLSQYHISQHHPLSSLSYFRDSLYNWHLTWRTTFDTILNNTSNIHNKIFAKFEFPYFNSL